MLYSFLGTEYVAMQAEQAESKEDKIKMYQTLIDFHGDLLMLMHWSMLAYTGLVKILKKHHKLTGARLHAPELEHLLSNPFCSVEVGYTIFP